MRQEDEPLASELVPLDDVDCRRCWCTGRGTVDGVKIIGARVGPVAATVVLLLAVSVVVACLVVGGFHWVQVFYFAWSSMHFLGFAFGWWPTTGEAFYRQLFFSKAAATGRAGAVAEARPQIKLLSELIHAQEIMLGTVRLVYALYYKSAAAWVCLVATGVYQSLVGLRMMKTGDPLCLQVVSREIVLSGGFIHVAVAAVVLTEVDSASWVVN